METTPVLRRIEASMTTVLGLLGVAWLLLALCSVSLRAQTDPPPFRDPRVSEMPSPSRSEPILRSTRGGSGDSSASDDLFPPEPLYQPMLADPKQPRFYASLYRYDSNVDRFTMGSVGFGEYFGLYRWGMSGGGAWQLGLQGGVFSQFNLNAPSTDLVNSDFNVGFPLSYRDGRFSARLQIYHQSSHLGDEFLLRADPRRINLSFESLEGLISTRGWGLRLYGGGEYLVRREPEDLERGILHAGLQSQNLLDLGPFGRLLGGVDLKSMEEHDWAVQVSLKAGVALKGWNAPNREVRLLLEGFKGHSPYGQFYDDRVAFYGLGLYFGL